VKRRCHLALALLLAGMALGEERPFPCEAKALHGREMPAPPIARDQRWDLFTGRLGERLVTLRLSGKRITGAVYDPASDRWTRTPAGPRLDPDSVTPLMPVGRYLLATDVRNRRWVFDADHVTWSALPTAIAFDPARTNVAELDDARWLVWPRNENAELFSRAWVIDLARGEKLPVASDGAPGPRLSYATARCGDQLLVWGGEKAVFSNGEATSTRRLRDGALLDLRTLRWKPVATDGAPTARALPAARCVGSRFLVFGGFSKAQDEPIIASGALYDPAQERWTALPTRGAPRIVWQHWDAQANEVSHHSQLQMTSAMMTIAGNHLVYLDPIETAEGPAGAVLDLDEGAWHPLPAPPTSDATVSFPAGAGRRDEAEALVLSGATALDDHRVLFLAQLDSTWKGYAAVLDVTKRSWCRVGLPPAGPLVPRASLSPAYSGTPEGRYGSIRPGSYLATLVEPHQLVIWGASAATVPPPCPMGARCAMYPQEELETTAGAVITW
jgi:hypothetical protein